MFGKDCEETRWEGEGVYLYRGGGSDSSPFSYPASKLSLSTEWKSWNAAGNLRFLSKDGLVTNSRSIEEMIEPRVSVLFLKTIVETFEGTNDNLFIRDIFYYRRLFTIVIVIITPLYDSLRDKSKIVMQVSLGSIYNCNGEQPEYNGGHTWR